jgi:hypothetical protein
MASDLPSKVASPVSGQIDEVNVYTEPTNARVWLDMIIDAERAFEDWHANCDNIDKEYANLERLSSGTRAKEFQMFWANMQVLAPSVYARPPVPVVVPKFKDRRPIFQAASEVAERCAIVAFDLSSIHNSLLLARDDMVLHGRGALWLRHERARDGKPEKVCIEHKDRRDFLHDPARNWYEVQWVAAASYLTREEARKRFGRYSGDAWDTAEYKIDREVRDVGGADDRERAKIWEVWHRGLGRVVWVSEGVDVLLDDAPPHLELQGYFPCPRPAYGTLQPGSLVPVPEVLYYRDQLQELDKLTGRIHALSDAVEVKGFYPSGGNEMADAIEGALRLKSNGRVLVPIKDWAAFGGSKEVIVWMPIDMIANTINVLVTLRKQIIDDIYQVMGLSDIMRGATDPNETLGAQQLKMQSGSVRIKDKQAEIARLSRECVQITTEIITEKFSDDTIMQMSQTQLPRKAEHFMQLQQKQQAFQQQAMQAQQRMQQLQAPPQGGSPGAPPGMGMQQGGPPPGAPPMQAPGGPPPGADPTAEIQAALQQAQSELESFAQKPTYEDVMMFLRSNRARNFVLDIETDSTIQFDEQKEKQSRAEFLQVLAPMLQQVGAMVSALPTLAGFAGEILKFGVAPYRVGRQLDNAIDEAVQTMMAAAGQAGQGGLGGPGDKNDKDTAASDAIKAQVEREKLQWQTQENEKERQLKIAELQMKGQLEMRKLEQEQQIARLEYEGNEKERQAKIIQINAQMQRDAQKGAIDQQNSQMKMGLDAQKQRIVQQGMQEKNAMTRDQMHMKAQDNVLNRNMKAQQFAQNQQNKLRSPP